MKTDLFKSFLYFSKGERKGILLLLFLTMLTMASPRIAGMLLNREEDTNNELSKEVTDFLNEIADSSSENQNHYTMDNYYGSERKSDQSVAGHQAVGFGPKVVRSVERPVVVLELNTADSVSLLEIKGIGPAFAHRILKYRDRLGGYVSVNQLLEVYGVTSEKFEEIKGSFKVNPSVFRKIDLNAASFKDLMKHPYSSYELAKAICNFRTKLGHIAQTDEILRAGVISDSSFRKLQPYLAAN